MIKTFNKNNMLFLLSILAIIMIIATFMPIKTYATTANDIFDDFNVEMDDEGNMTVASEADTSGAWKTLIIKYKSFITGIAAVGAVTMVILFIMQFLKLGASAGNPSARSQALVGVLWTGIAAAGLGAVALITGIFYRAI